MNYPTTPCPPPDLKAEYVAARSRIQARFRPGRPSFLTPDELDACEYPTLPCPPPEPVT